MYVLCGQMGSKSRATFYALFCKLPIDEELMPVFGTERKENTELKWQGNIYTFSTVNVPTSLS